MRAKELAGPRTHSGCVGVAFEDLEKLCGFLEVWQLKGLWSEDEELREGALTGGTGRAIIPTDMRLL
jgi:hypothetical protein